MKEPRISFPTCSWQHTCYRGKSLVPAFIPLLLRTLYSKEVRDHQLGVKWALGELGCEPLSVSCYRGCGAGACVARLGKERPRTDGHLACLQQCLHYFLTSMAMKWPLGIRVQAGDLAWVPLL